MKRLILIALIVLGSFPPAIADLTVERQSKLSIKDITDVRQRINREERIRIKGGNLRIDDLTFGEVWIVRMDLKLLWRIDTMEHTYSEWSFDALTARRQQVLAEIRNTRHRVEKSEEEQTLTDILVRFGVEGSSTPAVLEEDSRTETVAGHTGRVQRLKIGDRLVMEASMAEDLPEGADYFRAMAALSCFPPEAIKKLDGRALFPLKGNVWYTWLLDRVAGEIETTKISRDPVDDAEFALPEKLKKVLYPAFDDIPESTAKAPAAKKDFTEDDIERDSNPFKPNKK